MNPYNKTKSWQEMQEEYFKNKKTKKTVFKKIIVLSLILFIAFIIVLSVFFTIITLLKTNIDINNNSQKSLEEVTQKKKLSKKDLNKIISDINLIKTNQNTFAVNNSDNQYLIKTSIDKDLQGYLLSSIDKLKALSRSKPEKIAFVVIEANTGRIIAMTGFDINKPSSNPCLNSEYPAASLFKIITAAAAIESLNYTPNTLLTFNGGKYTLYKNQLKNIKNRYTNKISFINSFAESINPVFGKIGNTYLGAKRLEQYAKSFGFNKEINSDISFFSGNFKTNSNNYHLAELSSGFNNDTTISPVFASMLSSAIINEGKIIEPSIVDYMKTNDGIIIYDNNKNIAQTAITSKTATTMIKLMRKTILKGTARNSFKEKNKDKILSKLLIGGKTGSLFNKKHTIKYDWFTGFAKDKKTKKKIALSIVVGHGEYIGKRAATYAKEIIKKHFQSN